MRPFYDECEDSVALHHTPTKNITRIICVQRLNHLSEPLFNSSLCSRDSGSPQHQPLGCQAVQIGVNSFGVRGSPCAQRHGLMRVSEKISWIRSEIMNEKFQNYFHSKRQELRVSQTYGFDI